MTLDADPDVHKIDITQDSPYNTWGGPVGLQDSPSSTTPPPAYESIRPPPPFQPPPYVDPKAIERKNTEIERLKATIRDQQNMVQASRDMTNDSHNKARDARTRALEAHQRAQQYKSQHDAITTELHNATQQNLRLFIDNADLEQTLTNTKRMAKIRESTLLENFDAEQKKLDATTLENKTQIKVLDAQRIELQRVHDELAATMTRLRQSGERNMTERSTFTRTQNMLKRAAADLNAKTKEIAILRTAIQVAKKFAQEMLAQKEQLRIQFEKQQQDLADTSEKLKHVETEKNRLRKDQDEFRRLAQEKQALFEQEQQAKDRQRDVTTELERKKRDLETQLQDARNTDQFNQQEKSRVIQELTKKQRQLEDQLRKQINYEQERVRKLTAQLNALETNTQKQARALKMKTSEMDRATKNLQADLVIAERNASYAATQSTQVLDQMKHRHQQAMQKHQDTHQQQLANQAKIQQQLESELLAKQQELKDRKDIHDATNKHIQDLHRRIKMAEQWIPSSRSSTRGVDPFETEGLAINSVGGSGGGGGGGGGSGGGGGGGSSGASSPGIHVPETPDERRAELVTAIGNIGALCGGNRVGRPDVEIPEKLYTEQMYKTTLANIQEMNNIIYTLQTLDKDRDIERAKNNIKNFFENPPPGFEHHRQPNASLRYWTTEENILDCITNLTHKFGKQFTVVLPVNTKVAGGYYREGGDGFEESMYRKTSLLCGLIHNKLDGTGYTPEYMNRLNSNPGKKADIANDVLILSNTITINVACMAPLRNGSRRDVRTRVKRQLAQLAMSGYRHLVIPIDLKVTRNPIELARIYRDILVGSGTQFRVVVFVASPTVVYTEFSQELGERSPAYIDRYVPRRQLFTQPQRIISRVNNYDVLKMPWLTQVDYDSVKSRQFQRPPAEPDWSIELSQHEQRMLQPKLTPDRTTSRFTNQKRRRPVRHTRHSSL